jgi:hypothetical protein
MARGCVWVYYTKEWASMCCGRLCAATTALQLTPLATHLFQLGSNVLKDKIWNSQAQNAGACATHLFWLPHLVFPKSFKTFVCPA